MTVLSKTVTVTADRMIRLEFAAPEDIPQGEAEVRVEIAPAVSIKGDGKVYEWEGALANSPNFSGDLAELRRKFRDDAW